MARLAHLSWDELRTRGQQEIAKRLDTTLYRLGFRFTGDCLNRLPETLPRFFFVPADLPRLTSLACERLSREVDQIIRDADRICRHRFDLLGYQDRDYGEEIDWHLDVVHKKQAPRKPWYKVSYLDFAEVGDSKITWELNRHQHLVTLAKAYCLTQRERFASELLRQWYHWQHENPYPIGINWASSLEVAFRSLSWLWVCHLLADCPTVREAFQLDLLRALAQNGRHIERYLSTYSSPNTHLLGEGSALFFIGTLCPQLPSARHWQQLGWEIVLHEAERQVQPDGMHFEQSTYYHVYALDFFLHSRILAACNGIPIPARFDQTLEKMLEVLSAVAQAGPPPLLGDDDGGRVFNPRRNRAEHLLDPLATGAMVFARADFKAASAGLREETLWLLGPEGVTKYEELSAIKSSVASVRFESCGIHIMAGPEPVAHQLVINAGPLGALTAGHSHADALSVQLSVNGREWLADSGTFCYMGGTERDFFRGTAAHNTLRVDALNQAEPMGPFAWTATPSVRMEKWVAGQTFDLFAGSHTGYCRLAEPVVHRRWVFGLKSRFWLVRDLAVGEGIHQLEIFWHLAPGFAPGHVGANVTVLTSGNKENLAFLPVEGQAWSQELIQGKSSPVYGKAELSPVLRFTTQAQLPTESAVVLLPLGQALSELGVFARIVDGAGDMPVRGYRYDSPGMCHYVFFSEGSQGWRLGPWASDAQFLYCGLAPEIGMQHWVICDGSYVEIIGEKVLGFKHSVERFECVSRGTARQIFSSDESVLSNLSARALASAEMILFVQGSDNTSGSYHQLCAESVEL